MKNYAFYVFIMYGIYTILRIRIERIAKKRKKMKIPAQFTKKIKRDMFLLNTLVAVEVAVIIMYILKLKILEYFNYNTITLIRIMGIIIGFIGIFIIGIATKTLDGEYSPTIEFKEGHRLIKWGIYKHIRHPIYTGFILLHLGVALSLSNYIVTFIWISGITFLLVLRIPVEEELLSYIFKREFLEYKEKTGLFIPLICRNKKKL